MKHVENCKNHIWELIHCFHECRSEIIVDPSSCPRFRENPHPGNCILSSAKGLCWSKATGFSSYCCELGEHKTSDSHLFNFLVIASLLLGGRYSKLQVIELRSFNNIAVESLPITDAFADCSPKSNWLKELWLVKWAGEIVWAISFVIWDGSLNKQQCLQELFPSSTGGSLTHWIQNHCLVKGRKGRRDVYPLKLIFKIYIFRCKFTFWLSVSYMTSCQYVSASLGSDVKNVFFL